MSNTQAELKKGVAYKKKSVLHKEIHQEKSNIRVLRRGFDFFRSALQTKANFIEFAHIRLLFLEHNDKVLKQRSII